jgi:hypothetical protein
LIRFSIIIATLVALAGCNSAPLVGGASSVQSTRTGAALLTLSGYEGFGLLYAAADIADIRFTVRNAGAVVYQTTMSTANVKTQHGTVPFSNLPVGTVSIDVEAHNTAGGLIGMATAANVAIVAGQTVGVSVILQLTDTPAPPPPAAALSGAAGLDVLVRDGFTLPTPPQLAAPAPVSGTYVPAAPPAKVIVTFVGAVQQLAQVVTLTNTTDLLEVRYRNYGDTNSWPIFVRKQDAGAQFTVLVDSGTIGNGQNLDFSPNFVGDVSVKIGY